MIREGNFKRPLRSSFFVFLSPNRAKAHYYPRSRRSINDSRRRNTSVFNNVWPRVSLSPWQPSARETETRVESQPENLFHLFLFPFAASSTSLFAHFSLPSAPFASGENLSVRVSFSAARFPDYRASCPEKMLSPGFVAAES